MTPAAMPPPPMNPPQVAERPFAEPLQAIAGFAALLREHGLQVGVAEQRAMVQAALALPLARHARLQAAWRAIACHTARDWRQWPELFDRYWHPERVRGTVRTHGATKPSRSLPQLVQALQQALDGATPPAKRTADTALEELPRAGDSEDTAAPRAQGGASRTEALLDRSLNQWLPQDLATLQALAERIARQLRRRLTRRWQGHDRGTRLDLRRTLRASLATGGELVAPAWRRPQHEQPRLFIAVDVSRSMETHAQLFLRIARAFVHGAGARVFVFHTRLAEVTALLQRDSAAVQEKINAVTAGFGGGTRIATSLLDLLQVHARQQLGRGARLWVLSDGFDADAPDELGRALAALQARGARITWFHPSPLPPASAAMSSARSAVQGFVRLTRLRDLQDAAPRLR